MTKKKNIRQRGKIKLSEYFKKLNEGDHVAIVNEKSIPSSFPKRMIGSTGVIVGSRGACKVINMMDGNKQKQYIVHPCHLKKIK